MRVAVLVPAYQAAAHLGEVLMRLQALPEPFDVLVVNDGSRDATEQVARLHGAPVVSFAGNRGKGHALLAGFEALTAYDAVITLDADGQHPPECIPEFVSAAEAGADVVLGRRKFEGGMPLVRRLANAVASQWASGLAGQTISDSQCGYRLYRRAVLDAVPVTPGRYEIESEMAVRAARLGFRVRQVEIPTVYGSEQSQIRVARDVPRILAVLARLTVEGLMPPRAMREAARRRQEAA